MSDPIYSRDDILAIIDETELAFSDDGSTWDGLVQKSSDSDYGRIIMVYAERWGKTMQYAIEQDGWDLADCWEQLSYDCDWEGQSGASYGCAVQSLVSAWAYGDELRVLHNAQYGISADQGGVVNPAILSF